MATAAALTATLLQTSGVPAVAQGWTKPALPQAESPVAGGPAGKAVPRKVTKGPRTPAEAPATSWPKASVATVTLRPETTRIKGLPLTLDTRVKRSSDVATGTYPSARCPARRRGRRASTGRSSR